MRDLKNFNFYFFMTFEAKDILSIHEKLLGSHRIESGYRNKGTVYSIFEKTRLQLWVRVISYCH